LNVSIEQPASRAAPHLLRGVVFWSIIPIGE
jgi:hypothetical protein